LMWHEIRKVAEVKPVIASMSDVAASGGYYMAMGCSKIVAEQLTLTGSIGVVTGKFNLGPLYDRVGFNKEILSRGRYAEVDADNRPFTKEEEEFFATGAQRAYTQFRDKAAMSRSMEVESMEEVAQGRVWTGKAAAQRSLVDAIGGINRAIALAKDLAKIPREKKVRLVELSRSQPSLQMLLSGTRILSLLLSWGNPVERTLLLRELIEPFVPDGVREISSGPQYLMDDILVDSVVTSDHSTGSSALSALSHLLDERR